jgi:hypothetical protein
MSRREINTCAKCEMSGKSTFKWYCYPVFGNGFRVITCDQHELPKIPMWCPLGFYKEQK